MRTTPNQLPTLQTKNKEPQKSTTSTSSTQVTQAQSQQAAPAITLLQPTPVLAPVIRPTSAGISPRQQLNIGTEDVGIGYTCFLSFLTCFVFFSFQAGPFTGVHTSNNYSDR